MKLEIGENVAITIITVVTLVAMVIILSGCHSTTCLYLEGSA
jgi:hypothetical protein